MGDAFALGFGATGVLGLISVTLPVPDTMDVRGTVAVALAALLTGIAVYPLRRAIPLWGYHLLLILAIVLISLSIEFNGDPANNNVMLYVFVSAFASWFFAPTWAFVYVLCSLVAYGVVQNDIAEGRMEPTALLVLAGVMLTIGAMSALFGVRARSLIRQLEAEATTDHLTGLLNRRGFQRLVDAELDRVTRRDSTFALVIGDLDRFKEVNDRLGHLGGDMALERISSVMDGARRRSDRIARVGGEEFAVLLPEADEKEAMIAAERMREKVGEAFEDRPVPLTISFGIAAYPRHGETWEQLMHSADQALYAAKALGRDRSVIFSDEVDAILERGILE